MLHSAKEEKTGEIFSGHPRRHAFGMFEFGFIENRAITDTMLEYVGFNGLSDSYGSTGVKLQVSILDFFGIKSHLDIPEPSCMINSWMKTPRAVVAPSLVRPTLFT